MMMISDFQFRCKIDNINPFKIEKFLQRTNLIKKVSGFLEKILTEQQQTQEGMFATETMKFLLHSLFRRS
jgi:hypothetical protein